MSGGLVGPPAPVRTQLIAMPRFVSPRVSLVRGSIGTSYQSTDNISLVGDNVPRFSSPGRLVVEGYKVNALRNPRFEGAVPPTTNPTYGNFVIGPGNGISLRIEETGIGDRGFPYMELSMTGTATATGVLIPTMENLMGVEAATGEPWNCSMYICQRSGTPGYVNTRLEPRPSDINNTVLAGFQSPLTTATPDWQRILAAGTLTAANVAFLRLNWRIEYVINRIYNERIRIAAPNLAKYGIPTTPIWPVAGTIQAQNRNTDEVRFDMPAGQGAAGGRFMTAAAGMWDGWGVMQADDGTNDNRVVLAVGPDDNNLRLTVVAGGAQTFNQVLGTVTPNTPFPAAMSWQPGQVTGQLAGQALQTFSGAVPGGLNRLRIGHGSATWDRPLYGEIAYLEHSDRAESMAALLAAAA